ncbi:hypothetical protein ASD78_03680 [Lysobacter sp. Root667]|uniref:hypothetical protein n=1 Tax=Lysobacter sp. Root667 TaxID=1736581 RepID=UPI0006F91B5B|nr:hypothetical protein [Lysobacter sp. Root667]KRA76744.1 hypothetical protein ASD78_03680 [Lysobacter sp. Root667]
MLPRLFLYAALAASFLLYGIGLSGPFLFDDAINLAPLGPWLTGDVGWQSVVFGNGSGLLGRSVSMASFLLSAMIGGANPYYFKLGNLLVHLACGLLAYALLRRMMAKDSSLAPRAAAMAAAATALWLLHPLHVSTVLYVIQRMAQLSTLFVLASLLVYVHGRNKLANDQRRQALFWLFGAFPALVVLGLLSKENAAVAPALCLVLELAYFSRESAQRRLLGTFYGLGLLLPAMLGVLTILLRPNLLLVGYEIRDFNMYERLLSQSRALVAYLGMLIFPRGPQMGVYTDGFATSTGLFAPLTTFFSILTLAAISVVAIRLRRRAPSVFAGWFFFLVAHAIESSVLPLELYYEHRNYLPSIGLLLMLAGLLAMLPGFADPRRSFRAALGVAVGLAALGLSAITWQQVLVWRSKDAIVDQAIANQPNSVRAVQAKVVDEINRGQYETAMRLLAPLAADSEPRTRLLAHLDMVSISCLSGSETDPEWLNAAIADARRKMTVGEIQAVGLLVQVSKEGRCHGLDDERIAGAIVAIADAATAQRDDILPKWQLRYAAALVYARSENWPQALSQARLAWQPQSAPEIGGLLVQALARNGRSAEAERLLEQLAKRIDARDKGGQVVLSTARAAIDASRAAAEVAPLSADGTLP